MVWLVYGVAALATVAGCAHGESKDPTASIHVQCDITPQPPRVGEVVVVVTLLDTAAAKAVPAAHIQLEADMSHPGMSPIFADTKEMDPGRYQGQIQFSMAGDWVLLLHITLANGHSLERQFDVQGVRAS